MIRPLARPAPGPAGPLGQGELHQRWLRVGPVAALAAGFTASAGLTFAGAWWVGQAFGLNLVPVAVTLAVGAAVCGAFAIVELRSLRRRTLCRVTWRRQTPKNLIYRYGPVRGPLIWGLDTGTGVTTFRVSGSTWVVLALVGLQLAPWWIGLAYAAGFALPLAAIILLVPVRPPDAAGAPREPHWISAALTRRRPVALAVNLLAMVGLLAVIGAYLTSVLAIGE